MATELMLIDAVTLKIDPPLPCAVVKNREACNRPARLAYAYRTSGPRSGYWLIMPICAECAGANAATHADAHDHR